MSDAAPQPGANSRPALQLLVSSRTAAADGASAELLRVPIGAASVAWQTPAGTTAAALTVTATAAVAWRAVCLARTNLTTAATIRVRVDSAASLTMAPAYDSGVVLSGVAVGIGQALHVMPTAVSALAMRIDISDAANPDGYLNIPLAYAGPGTEFNVSYSSDAGLDVRRGDTTTRGGQVFVDALSRARGWNLHVGYVRDATLGCRTSISCGWSRSSPPSMTCSMAR